MVELWHTEATINDFWPLLTYFCCEKPLKWVKFKFYPCFISFYRIILFRVVIGHFLLRPCAIIRPLRIYQQLNGLCRTNIKEVMALSKVNFTTRSVPAAEAAPVCPKTRFFRLIWQALTMSYAAIIEWACCCQYRPPTANTAEADFFPYLLYIYIYIKREPVAP